MSYLSKLTPLQFHYEMCRVHKDKLKIYDYEMLFHYETRWMFKYDRRADLYNFQGKKQIHLHSRSGTYYIIVSNKKYMLLSCAKFVTLYKSGQRDTPYFIVPLNDFACYKQF